MIAGLNVGFEGHLVGRPLLDDLSARGVRMVRHDCLEVGNAADLTNIITETVDAGLAPLVVMRPDQMLWLPSVAVFGILDVEIWNEPDIGTPPTRRMTPQDYAEEARAAHDYNVCGHRLWAGVISNLDVDSLEWLKASIAAGWPEGVGVSAHWYPPKGSLPPDNAHKGFGSRRHEAERLKAVIGDRPFLISECGYNDGESLTPQQVLEATRFEVEFWTEQGATALILYQVNDGPGTSYLDHFGWRDTQGNWKPVSEALRT